MIDKFLISKFSEFLGVIAVLLIAGTSGGLTFRPVDFKYPKREVRFSAVLYGLILLVSLGLYSRLVPQGIFNMQAPLDYLQRELTLALISLVLGLGLLFYRHQPFLSAGWGKNPNLKTGLRVGLMLVFLTVFLRGKIFSLIDGVSAQEGLALLFCIVIAIAEESVFRGYLQLRLSAWLGKRNGWLLTSLAFVIWRLPILFFNPADFWINLFTLVIQSILLGWIMQKSGHVLAPGLYRAVSDWLLYLA